MRITSPATVPKGCCPLLQGRHVASSNDQESIKRQSVSGLTRCRILHTNEREVAFHCAQEALSILSRADDSGLAFIGTSAQERRVLDPTLEFLIPGIGSDIICRLII